MDFYAVMNQYMRQYTIKLSIYQHVKLLYAITYNVATIIPFCTQIHRHQACFFSLHHLNHAPVSIVRSPCFLVLPCAVTAAIHADFAERSQNTTRERANDVQEKEV
jgi:hypothetical protein